jgi:DNA-binding transcriptional ArsR family regulator
MMTRIALDMAQLASLIGDVSRANMLTALMDGRALTALELSLAAHVTPQTASAHLAKLLAAELLAVERQGRHRYYRLASAQVARTLEAVMALATGGPPRHRPRSRLDDELRLARSCYDHLAGRIGVGIADSLLRRRHVVLEGDGGEVTEPGRRFFAELGVDLAMPRRVRRVFCRPCLDWSERRCHLAGRVGAAIATLCFERDWLARKPGSRALTVTPEGRVMLPAAFGADLLDGAAEPWGERYRGPQPMP